MLLVCFHCRTDAGPAPTQRLPTEGGRRFPQGKCLVIFQLKLCLWFKTPLLLAHLLPRCAAFKCRIESAFLSTYVVSLLTVGWMSVVYFNSSIAGKFAESCQKRVAFPSHAGRTRYLNLSSFLPESIYLAGIV